MEASHDGSYNCERPLNENITEQLKARLDNVMLLEAPGYVEEYLRKTIDFDARSSVRRKPEKEQDYHSSNTLTMFATDFCCYEAIDFDMQINC